MRKGLLAAVLSLFGAVSADPAEMREASMNFDLENVEPFVTGLEQKLELGLDVAKLARFTSETSLDQERSITLIVNFAGRPVQLEYRVFMDDIAAPDIYFLTPSNALADAINAEMTSFADENEL